MQQINLEDAKSQLPALVDAALDGQKVIIEKDPGHFVALVRVPMSRKQPKFGSAKGQIKMADDFDESLDDFEDYMR